MRVSWYRSAQARYLIARHDAGGIKLTDTQRALLLEIVLAGRDRRQLTTAKIWRLRRLVKTIAPAHVRRRHPPPPPEPTHDPHWI